MGHSPEPKRDSRESVKHEVMSHEACNHERMRFYNLFIIYNNNYY